MSVLCRCVCLCLVFATVSICGSCSMKKINVKKFKFFNWENPAPRFSDLGLDLEELRTIIGNSQLLISHKERDIRFWSHKEKKIKTFNNARFVSSLTIFNVPKYKVLEAFLEFNNYPEMFQQYEKGDIVKKDNNFFLVQLKHAYKLLLLNIRSNFVYQYKIEDNGDFSALMLDGDFGAGLKRLEFIPLDDDHTLVAVTSWMDSKSARLIYRATVKAQPDMESVGPLAVVAMENDQIKAYLEKKIPDSKLFLPEQPEIPIYAKSGIPLTTLHQISDLGTLVFVHDNQWIRTKDGVTNVKFVSSLNQLPGALKQVHPISSDFSRFDEYFKHAKKVVVRRGDSGNEIDWHLKFGLGFMGVSVDYTITYNWQNQSTVLFDRISGDMDPLYGAWEWIQLDPDKTLLVFTVASQIGDEASFFLKILRRIPNVDVISSLIMGMLIVEKQPKWLEKQLEKPSVFVKNEIESDIKKKKESKAFRKIKKDLKVSKKKKGDLKSFNPSIGSNEEDDMFVW